MVNIPENAVITTENRILEAAKKVFIMHGFEGTAMQDIADEACINKSLLHYYFRNKAKLFEAVIVYAFKNFVPQLKEILSSDLEFPEKIERVVSEYMDMLMKNPFIPVFILHEINRNPDGLFEIMHSAGIEPSFFISSLQNEFKDKNTDHRHFIMNLVSLCVFPVAAAPLIQRLLNFNDQEEYTAFLHERKKIVARLIINSIKY